MYIQKAYETYQLRPSTQCNNLATSLIEPLDAKAHIIVSKKSNALRHIQIIIKYQNVKSHIGITKTDIFTKRNKSISFISTKFTNIYIRDETD
jgi:hypothetical protein